MNRTTGCLQTIARLASGALAGPSGTLNGVSLGMVATYEAIPSQSMVHCGTCLTFTRSKVYTSNVMDDVRRRRIHDHFTYWKERKQWKLKMHSLLESWRAELKGNQAAAEAKKRQVALEVAATNQAETEELARRRQLLTLEEELRRAQLDVDTAQVKLQRALRVEGRERQKAMVLEARRQRLLEASRSWVSRDELLERINTALDSPKPFGFVTTLPKVAGY